MKIPKSTKKAFTLVELIIVVSIIAVIASLAFMSLSGETAQARDSKRDNDLKTFEDAVSTSYTKNKIIGYKYDTFGKTHLGNSRNDTLNDTLETNTGILKSIRGAYLVPVTRTLFDSDIISNIEFDPKGSNYFVAFISETDYSFYATKENPESKTPSAIVKGSFKEGMILDVLMEYVGGSNNDKELIIANPKRFIFGDIIKIDNELMVITGYKKNSRILYVERGYDSKTENIGENGVNITVHNKDSKIKLMDAAKGSESLICIGSQADAVENKITFNSTGNNDFKSYTPTLTSGAETGIVCNYEEDKGHPITDINTKYLPYKVN